MQAYSWIKAELGRAFPRANLAQGVDLNKNGTLEAHEKITDANGNGTVGDAADWQAFLRRNKSSLGALPGIFKEGAFLKPDNPIHDVLSIERPLATAADITKIYGIIKRALVKLRQKLAAQKPRSNRSGPPADAYEFVDRLYPEESISQPAGKGMAIYKALEDVGITFSNVTRGTLLVQNIRNSTVDCDTGSYLVLAIAHEMGWPMHFVEHPGIPTGHAFVRWDDGKGKRVNIDHMGSKPDSYYKKTFRVHPDTVRKTTAFKNLTHDRFAAAALGTLAGELLTAKRHRDALSSALLAHKLNPKSARINYWLGAAYHLTGNYRTAIGWFTKAIDLNPWYVLGYIARSNAHSNLGMTEQAKRDMAKARSIDPIAVRRALGKMINR